MKEIFFAVKVKLIFLVEDGYRVENGYRVDNGYIYIFIYIESGGWVWKLVWPPVALSITA